MSFLFDCSIKRSKILLTLTHQYHECILISPQIIKKKKTKTNLYLLNKVISEWLFKSVFREQVNLSVKFVLWLVNIILYEISAIHEEHVKALRNIFVCFYFIIKKNYKCSYLGWVSEFWVDFIIFKNAFYWNGFLFRHITTWVIFHI